MGGWKPRARGNLRLFVPRTALQSPEYQPTNPHTDLHVLCDLQEGVGHTTTNNHFIDFVQHVFNQLNLVCNLRSAQCK